MTPAAGYVYVASLSNGTVKVGRSRDAGKRLGTHKANARTLGLAVTDSWTSPLHLEWVANEDALKKIAADLGGIPESRETFSGVEFAAVVEKAGELTFTSSEPVPEAQGPARGPAPEVPEFGGRLTPRERAVAIAALEVGMSDADKADLFFDGQVIPLLTVTSLLDEGGSMDDLIRLSPDRWDPGIDGVIRAMRALVFFERAIERAIERKEAVMKAVFDRTKPQADAA